MKSLLAAVGIVLIATTANAATLHGVVYHGAKYAAKKSYAGVKYAGKKVYSGVKHL